MSWTDCRWCQSRTLAIDRQNRHELLRRGPGPRGVVQARVWSVSSRPRRSRRRGRRAPRRCCSGGGAEHPSGVLDETAPDGDWRGEEEGVQRRAVGLGGEQRGEERHLRRGRGAHAHAPGCAGRRRRSAPGRAGCPRCGPRQGRPASAPAPPGTFGAQVRLPVEHSAWHLPSFTGTSASVRCWPGRSPRLRDDEGGGLIGCRASSRPSPAEDRRRRQRRLGR
jgi:hypothetical protein